MNPRTKNHMQLTYLCLKGLGVTLTGRVNGRSSQLRCSIYMEHGPQ